MTGTVYLSVRDDELRAEDEGGKVRIVVGNFAWTFVLENRLDCARWAKVIADADALFIRRKTTTLTTGTTHVIDWDERSDPSEEFRSDEIADVLAAEEEDADIADDGLEPLPPLPQRTTYPELAPEALAGEQPLESLAPEPGDTPGEDEEAEA